ncbi:MULTISPECIES: head GIN domain-containing protein [Mesonia]|uniref:Uncharacterized protein n=1 Tax=Mesonia oceanica TaxID=2687242 RepID=A0AC61Y4A6_9FLAO|nr:MULTISPECIES: head GIN domain-containing protein [Mesonia]MAN28025.1 hypothetical protein [Mesonia sp.]MAQ42444.1 hypothetical protein [Mesonia sp.]MBJ96750.1 hypothetical protein [Flavobacteriaceae bacterium]VVU99270.1 hypothetical protein FVB9532_00522 [Mesonia oceanica]|tara:strand:- start:7528 stop:8259 length:732 start_codon:yes stop_codon:yes gene_type:complete
MKFKLTKIVLLVMLSSLVVACNFDISGIRGKGEVITKEIPLNDNFTEIKGESGWNIQLVKSSENKIILNTNENLVEQLDYRINNNRLTLGSKNNISSGTREITLYHTESLVLVKSSSGSRIKSEDIFEQKEITVDASSGSSIELKLKVRKTTVDASSGAKVELEGTSIYFDGESSSGSSINAKELKTKECLVDASSGGNIDIYNEGSIKADVSSGGNIDYYGKPEKVSTKKSISGGSIDYKKD